MELAQSTANLMKLMSSKAVVIDLAHRVLTATNDKFRATFGLSEGEPLDALDALFYETPTLRKANRSIQQELADNGVSTWAQVAMLTATRGIRNYDLRVGYVDDSKQSVYLIFSPSARDLEQLELRNGYHEVISAASFSYPFYLNIPARRMEFFGPIVEQFKLSPVMENFPEPALAGGMIFKEDLDGYLAMIDRMYKGEPPAGSFRTYTPTGEVLCYTVNYTVRFSDDGQPLDVIGDFITKQDFVADPAAGSDAQPDAAENGKHHAHNQVLVHQIKAHFFFNTLNTISALCKQDAAKADIAIQTFASYMRSYMYLITEEHNIPFDQELSMVRSSLEIERMRFPNSFTYTLDLQFRDFELPPLCLQPIVENALLHGLRKTGRHGQLKISTKKVGDIARITVEDDGRGFDTAILKKSASIGLHNLIERVDIMANGTVNITSKRGKGTVAVIELPIG